MAKKIQGIRLEPDLPLLPGNTATFVAPPAKAGQRLQAKIVTARGTWMGGVSSIGDGVDDIRVSKIIETNHGKITVEIYADGKKHAEGSWEV